MSQVKEVERIFKQLGLTAAKFEENQLFIYFAGKKIGRPAVDGVVYLGTPENEIHGRIDYVTSGTPGFALNIPGLGFCCCDMYDSVFWYSFGDNVATEDSQLRDIAKVIPRLKQFLGWSSSESIR